MIRTFVLTLTLLVSACANQTVDKPIPAMGSEKFIDFAASSTKNMNPILYANSNLYNHGYLCRFFIDQGAKAIRLSRILESTRYSIDMQNALRASAEFQKWENEIKNPQNEDYYGFATGKVARMKEELRSTIVKNTVPPLKQAISHYIQSSNVEILLNGDVFAEYADSCPELFSPETFVIDQLDG